MKRIFFVEDDASLRSGLTFALEKQGYAVTAGVVELSNNVCNHSIP